MKVVSLLRDPCIAELDFDYPLDEARSQGLTIVDVGEKFIERYKRAKEDWDEVQRVLYVQELLARDEHDPD